MRQVSLIALVSVLALFMGGCPASDEGDQATQSTPVPSATARPARQKPLFAPSPLVPQQPRNTTAVSGLVQTSPPDSVAKQIAKGRSDPFAAIPVQPEVTISPNSQGDGGINNRPVPSVPPLPPPATQRQPRGVANGSGGTAPSRRNVLPRPSQQRQSPSQQRQSPSQQRRNPGSQGPIAFRPRPGTTGLPPVITPPPPAFTPSLPRLPEPSLAKSIVVTGVVEVSGVPTAIVKAPNEPDRYVQEGQRLLNGQVLVKRIEMNRGPIPVVILEQYGIEVAKQVGERPAGSPEGGESPTASLPALTPGITSASKA